MKNIATLINNCAFFTCHPELDSGSIYLVKNRVDRYFLIDFILLDRFRIAVRNDTMGAKRLDCNIFELTLKRRTL